MNNFTAFISAAATIIGLLISALTFLIGFIKNTKAKKTAQQIITIGNAVLPYIEEAEKFSAYSGKEKKEYVMTKANQFAIDSGIKFNAELVSTKIEELVNLTKTVNKREKDQVQFQIPSQIDSTKGILSNII